MRLTANNEHQTKCLDKVNCTFCGIALKMRKNLLKYKIIDDLVHEKEGNDRKKNVLSGGQAYISSNFNEFVNPSYSQNLQEKNENWNTNASTSINVSTSTSAWKSFLQLTYPYPQSIHQDFFKKNLLDNLRPILEQSMWYYGPMSETECLKVLQDMSPGTFLLRDSSHAEYLLTLSLKTIYATISIRIQFKNNLYSLVPSEEHGNQPLPKFSSVPALIEFYREAGKVKLFGNSLKNFRIVFPPKVDFLVNISNETINSTESEIVMDTNIDNSNNDFDFVADFELITPLYKQVPSLKHFSRLAVNKVLTDDNINKLNSELLTYLNKYSFTI